MAIKPLKKGKKTMKTLKELAKEALQVQDACNLSGVAQSFAKVMIELSEHTNGTKEKNQHAIVKVWLNKMLDLANGDATSQDWNKVHELAETTMDGLVKDFTKELL